MFGFLINTHSDAYTEGCERLKKNPWLEYEKQKALLRAKGLSQKDYEREIQKLARRLGI